MSVVGSQAPCGCPLETNPLVKQWQAGQEACKAMIDPGNPGYSSCLALQLGWVMHFQQHL